MSITTVRIKDANKDLLLINVKDTILKVNHNSDYALQEIVNAVNQCQRYNFESQSQPAERHNDMLIGC